MASHTLLFCKILSFTKNLRCSAISSFTIRRCSAVFPLPLPNNLFSLVFSLLHEKHLELTALYLVNLTRVKALLCRWPLYTRNRKRL